MVIGLFLISISTFGPLSKSQNHINQLTEIQINKVTSIKFQPTRDKGFENIIPFDNEIVVTDKKAIDDLCSTLKKATLADAGFVKNPEFACRVEIKMIDNKTLIFGIKKSGQSTCLTIDSNGESGWHFANLEANEFGLLFDKIRR